MDDQLIAKAVKQLKIRQLALAFDPTVLDSRPTPMQQQVLDDIVNYPHRYLIGGNQSGKSMTGGREAAWILSGTHPTYKVPERRQGHPLTMIIVGRTLQQVSDELWAKKIRPFLDPGSYKEHKIAGGVVTAVDFKANKNRLLLFSHHSPREAREKLQSFTCDWLWLDEMPDSMQLIEELHRRCQANQGRFLATFTPKLRNNEIRKMVDNITPYQKTYRIGMLDNPSYRGREAEVLAPITHLPEALRDTVLNGAWYTGELAVYNFNVDVNCKQPVDYSFSWRHIEAIDPASSGKAGYVILAEHPVTGVWHTIVASYINGASAKNLLIEMAKLRGNVNLVRRISDPHESWFIKHAADDGLTYEGVYKKNERKKELIKNLQVILDEGRLVVEPYLEDLIGEFTTCQWSETVDDKITGSRRFHLLDALQYAVDNLPVFTAVAPIVPRNQWLRQANQQRKAATKERAAAPNGKLPRGRLVARRGRVLKHA